MEKIIATLIIFFGLINLIRISIMLVGSDLYSLKQHKNNKKRTKNYEPKFSVIIPAYNESKTILRTISSVVASNYPKNKLQIIVIDDGSKDKTFSIANQYKQTNKISNLVVIRQKNTGKANALNNAIKNYATGELIMCLDADSCVDPSAIKNATKYFKNKNVAGLSSNVRIIQTGTLLNLIQQFEYLICYQMKRAQTYFNMEYIIGGIGSTFRKSILEEVNFYDTNTVTEDIDLTMKIISRGNKKYKAIYGSDVIAFTESVIDIRGLIKQRYRWKYGRCQTFLKNRNMFFSLDKKYSKSLTLFYLPYALFGDLAFIIEPILTGFIFYVVIRYGDLTTLVSAFLLISSYIILNILAEDTIKIKDKIKLLLISPTMYFYFFILSFVEYIALIKAIINLKNLSSSIKQSNHTWVPVTRSGVGS
jgi:cellulose synthase/poly-beta-1,6-N-acetylglucosamine synthase-like glycosyltransferase